MMQNLNLGSIVLPQKYVVDIPLKVDKITDLKKCLPYIYLENTPFFENLIQRQDELYPPEEKRQNQGQAGHEDSEFEDENDSTNWGDYEPVLPPWNLTDLLLITNGKFKDSS